MDSTRHSRLVTVVDIQNHRLIQVPESPPSAACRSDYHACVALITFRSCLASISPETIIVVIGASIVLTGASRLQILQCRGTQWSEVSSVTREQVPPSAGAGLDREQTICDHSN